MILGGGPAGPLRASETDGASGRSRRGSGGAEFLADDLGAGDHGAELGHADPAGAKGGRLLRRFVRKDGKALRAGRITKTGVETHKVAAEGTAIGPHERGGEL